ncbi:MAG: hypothetical protein JNL84_03875 [Candidatus Accumulibacter sp.]|nr:hypothetical protein [Accumulibacter sp.]
MATLKKIASGLAGRCGTPDAGWPLGSGVGSRLANPLDLRSSIALVVIVKDMAEGQIRPVRIANRWESVTRTNASKRPVK